MDLPESFPLTYDLLFKLVNPLGNYTKATCEALGVKFPPKSTWQMKFVGKVITRDKYMEALAGREPKRYASENAVVKRANPGWAVMGGQYGPDDEEMKKARILASELAEKVNGRPLTGDEETAALEGQVFPDGHWEWKFGDRLLVAMEVRWDRGSSRWLSKIVPCVAG